MLFAKLSISLYLLFYEKNITNSQNIKYNTIVISGIGIDLVNLEQFKRHINHSPYFKSRLFSQEEHVLTDNQLAGNFATKEALFKASSIKFEYSNCSVLRDKNGKPFIVFNNDITTYEHVHIFISITNNEKYSVAIVLLEPKQEL